MTFWSRMLNRPRGRLARRLRERIVSLTASVADGEKPDPEALQEVETLLRVMELQSAARGRWRIGVAVAAGIALIVGLSLLSRVDVIEVEGSVNASALEIVVDEDRPVLSVDQPLQVFYAAGMTRLGGLQVAGELPGSVSVAPLPGGTLTLQQVSLAQQTRLGIKSNGEGRVSLRIIPLTSGGQLVLALTGPSRISLPQNREVLGNDPDQLLSLDFGPERFDMSFVPTDSATELLTGVMARSLYFSELWVPTEGARSDVTHISTIIGGALTFPEMRQQVVLRAREHLEMDVRALQVHRLLVASDGIVLEFRARVSGISLGSAGARRDLRPSVLEWYAANHRLELARTAFISTLLMLAGLLAWWRTNR